MTSRLTVTENVADMPWLIPTPQVASVELGNNAQVAPAGLASFPPVAREAEGKVRKQPLRKGKGRRVDLNEVPDSDFHCKVLPSRAVVPDPEIASQENDEGCGYKLPAPVLDSSWDQ